VSFVVGRSQGVRIGLEKCRAGESYLSSAAGWTDESVGRQGVTAWTTACVAATKPAVMTDPRRSSAARNTGEAGNGRCAAERTTPDAKGSSSSISTPMPAKPTQKPLELGFTAVIWSNPLAHEETLGGGGRGTF
jgi:hypothetical protein